MYGLQVVTIARENGFAQEQIMNIHKKGTAMKNPINIDRKLLPVIALALAALAPTAARGADEMKPMHQGEHMMMLIKISTQAEAEALKPGDSIAMVCTKCKSIMVQNVTTEKAHIKMMTVGEKHMCPGCQSTVTVVGVGKGAKQKVKHVCEKCGANSIFCCATKPGSGPTEGMEKK